MSIVALLMTAGLLAGQTQTPPPQTPPPTDQAAPTRVDDVEVTARQNTVYEAARSFIDEVTETPPRQGLARWDRRVCVGIANLRADIAQPLIDRISDNVASVGLEVGEPGCRPNVLIVATSDGPGMARALVEAKPRVFNPGVTGTRLTLAALERFQSNDAPVRWWRITLPVDSDTRQLTVRQRGMDAPMRNLRAASRLRTQNRSVFARIFIIVDLPKAAGTDVGALGDYLAMAALAQIDADADVTGYDTILNLFAEPDAPRTMTDWDRDYLKALYEAELNESHVTHQVGATAGAVARTRDEREAEAE